uniref:Venom peptide meuPep28 n=1 Tax=Mesobuthus eupeus TaxID=34648 RepID=A0A146CJ36_MESEU|nr:venom peptide meuPep28 [Mesobuthus eupeus]
MVKLQVILIAFIAVIACSVVYGDSVAPWDQTNSYYGCQKQTDKFCDKVCKLHLASSGSCQQPTPFVKLCKCQGLDYENSFFFAAMEKQCPKFRA